MYTLITINNLKCSTSLHHVMWFILSFAGCPCQLQWERIWYEYKKRSIKWQIHGIKHFAIKSENSKWNIPLFRREHLFTNTRFKWWVNPFDASSLRLAYSKSLSTRLGAYEGMFRVTTTTNSTSKTAWVTSVKCSSLAEMCLRNLLGARFDACKHVQYE